MIRSFRYSDSANRLVDAMAEQRRLTQSSGLPALFSALLAGQVQANANQVAIDTATATNAAAATRGK